MDASGNPYGNPYDNMDQHETSHLSWMEKIFAVNLRNDKDWRNFKNVQKHSTVCLVRLLISERM